MKFPAAQKKLAAAFTLVEVVLALGVASFCLIPVMALMPLGIATGQQASDQAAASSILTHVLADLRATPTTSPPGAAATSAEYAVKIPAHAANTVTPPTVLYFGNSVQQFSVSPNVGNSRYRLTVSFLPPLASDRAATGVTLLVSWPPQVDPATGTPTGRVQIFAGLDRN